MIRGLRPLLRGSTYTGALFASCGALASLPLLPFALLPALMWRSAPEGLQLLLVLLAWAALIGLIGQAGTTRRVLVVSARRLLKLPLPDPAAVRRPAGPPGTGPTRPAAPAAAQTGRAGADRWRTPLWLLLHVALGWTVALVGGLLLLIALTLPGLVPG
ncbi:hypothetical protein ACFQ0M_08520 [Kitasatospora aburaviensis]